MNILQNENDYEKINKLEEMEIINESTSQNILIDVVNGRNDPLYKILHSSARFLHDDKPKGGKRHF